MKKSQARSGTTLGEALKTSRSAQRRLLELFPETTGVHCSANRRAGRVGHRTKVTGILINSLTATLSRCCLPLRSSHICGRHSDATQERVGTAFRQSWAACSIAAAYPTARPCSVATSAQWAYAAVPILTLPTTSLSTGSAPQAALSSTRSAISAVWRPVAWLDQDATGETT